MQLNLGSYRVVQVKLNSFTINLGRNIHTTVTVPFLPAVKVGDFVQLYTDVEVATVDKVKSD